MSNLRLALKTLFFCYQTLGNQREILVPVANEKAIWRLGSRFSRLDFCGRSACWIIPACGKQRGDSPPVLVKKVAALNWRGEDWTVFGRE